MKKRATKRKATKTKMSKQLYSLDTIANPPTICIECGTEEERAVILQVVKDYAEKNGIKIKKGGAV